ncbi:MAG: Hpt domain-containing protein [Pseudomonadota bacterium]
MIDWTRVGDLRDEVGAEDFEEVVELFIEEVDEAIERLRAEAYETSLAAELHFLKGSAMNLGFSGFADLCSAAEQTAEQGGQVNTAGIVASYEMARTAFLAERAERLAA